MRFFMLSIYIRYEDNFQNFTFGIIIRVKFFSKTFQNLLATAFFYEN